MNHKNYGLFLTLYTLFFLYTVQLSVFAGSVGEQTSGHMYVQVQNINTGNEPEDGIRFYYEKIGEFSGDGKTILYRVTDQHTAEAMGIKVNDSYSIGELRTYIAGLSTTQADNCINKQTYMVTDKYGAADEELPVGLYLFKSSRTVAFLAEMPVITGWNNGTMVCSYDVRVYPKIEKETTPPTDPSNPTDPTSPDNPTKPGSPDDPDDPDNPDHKKSFVPFTGGDGTGMFALAGAALLGAGVLLLLPATRKKKKRRKNTQTDDRKSVKRKDI